MQNELILSKTQIFDAEPKDADLHLICLWAGCQVSAGVDPPRLSIHMVGVPLLLFYNAAICLAEGFCKIVLQTRLEARLQITWQT